MTEIDGAIHDLAKDAVASTDTPLEAITQLMGNADGTCLTPHGLVEAAKAVETMTSTEFSDTALHDLASRAAVNVLRARDTSPYAVARREQLEVRRESARRHIQKVRAARLNEQSGQKVL